VIAGSGGQIVTTGGGAGNLMASIKANDVTTGDTVSDMTEFAVNLLKNTYDGDNTVVSPVSAYLALAMTANGAGGLTLREFERVLGASLSDLDDTGKLLLDAFNEASGVTLKGRQRHWYDTAAGFTPDERLPQANADYFDAAAEVAGLLENGDGSKPQRVYQRHSNGLIKDMLEPSRRRCHGPRQHLVFKGDWASQFDPYTRRTRGFNFSADNSAS
jgi:serpin B